MKHVKLFLSFVVLSCFFKFIAYPLYADAAQIDRLLSQCDDSAKARALQYGIKPVDTIKFGLSIQERVSSKSMQGLLELVNGELTFGPRKAFASQYQFDELFSAEWQQRVLDATPMCSPHPPPSPEGIFTLGPITYNTKSHIIGIYDTPREQPLSNQKWLVDGVRVNGSCFVQEWWSSENFHEFASRFNVPLERLRSDIGQLFGNGINDYAPIIPGWEAREESPQTIALINSLQTCNNKVLPELTDGYGEPVYDETQGYVDYDYTLWYSVSPEQCSALAPNIGAPCLESYLVQLSNYSGGSIGVKNSHVVFGVFDLPELGKSIVPLHMFDTANDGLNLVSP